MTLCIYCAAVGGYHYFGCLASRRERRSQMAPPVVAKQEYRIEWTGNIQVHQPVRSAA